MIGHYSPQMNIRNSEASDSESKKTSWTGASGPNQFVKNKKSRSSSVGQQPVLFYNKMLKNDGQYCIFTTRDQSKNVFACDQPYSGKLLNDSFIWLDIILWLAFEKLALFFESCFRTILRSYSGTSANSFFHLAILFDSAGALLDIGLILLFRGILIAQLSFYLILICKI